MRDHKRHRLVSTTVWFCPECSFDYDESAGLPSSGIPPGTRWASIPADWCCPECRTPKDRILFSATYIRLEPVPGHPEMSAQPTWLHFDRLSPSI